MSFDRFSEKERKDHDSLYKFVSSLVLTTLIDTKGDHIYMVDYALQN